MAEHPFERFRRLRGLAVPEGPAPPPAVQDAEALPLTPLELFQRLHARGVRLRPFPDGTLQCQAPDGAWTPALRQAFQTHHGALHALVETFEERAALAEHGGGLTRAEAEQLAWLCSGKDQRGPAAPPRPAFRALVLTDPFCGTCQANVAFRTLPQLDGGDVYCCATCDSEVGRKSSPG